MLTQSQLRWLNPLDDSFVPQSRRGLLKGFLMEEIWRPLPDFEDLYEVSNFGNVRSYKTGKILKQGITHKGYPCVSISRKQKTYLKTVHRILAVVFLSATDEHVVNHKDKNKTNNRLDNLELVSTRENVTHYFGRAMPGAFRLKGSDRWSARATYQGKGLYIGTFKTQREAYDAYCAALEELGLSNKYAEVYTGQEKEIIMDRYQDHYFWLSSYCPACGHIGDKMVYTPDLLSGPMELECARDTCSQKWGVAMDEPRKEKIRTQLALRGELDALREREAEVIKVLAKHTKEGA